MDNSDKEAVKLVAEIARELLREYYRCRIFEAAMNNSGAEAAKACVSQFDEAIGNTLFDQAVR